MRLGASDADAVASLIADLQRTAEAFVRKGAEGPLTTTITAFMRYVGQGWEIPVPISDRPLDAARLREAFQREYARFFGRAIDAMGDLEIEVVTWSVKVQDQPPAPARIELDRRGTPASPAMHRQVFDPAAGAILASGVYERGDLETGARIEGPAVIVERETATILTSRFDAVVQSDGAILLIAKGALK
jgi:N-methylhydantoinase A